jgi:mono/diheme cytochrome c family protein
VGWAFVLVGAVAAAAGVTWFRTHNLGPVERGARLAAANGCLGCHGSAGSLADPDATRGVGSVPGFTNEDVTAHARSREEIREWILDGRPRRLREEEPDEEPALFRMPAWRERLSPEDTDALVAWIAAVSDFEPVPEPIAAARRTITVLGCFACHGAQGRGDTPNPGSLKGYIPSWSGDDFTELVRDDAELREWVRDGAPRRLRENPLAAFFLDRQAVRMPAYGARVTDEELRQITDYVRWLRDSAPPEPRSRAAVD